METFNSKLLKQLSTHEFTCSKCGIHWNLMAFLKANGKQIKLQLEWLSYNYSIESLSYSVVPVPLQNTWEITLSYVKELIKESFIVRLLFQPPFRVLSEHHSFWATIIFLNLSFYLSIFSLFFNWKTFFIHHRNPDNWKIWYQTKQMFIGVFGNVGAARQAEDGQFFVKAANSSTWITINKFLRDIDLNVVLLIIHQLIVCTLVSLTNTASPTIKNILEGLQIRSELACTTETHTSRLQEKNIRMLGVEMPS